MAPRLISPVLVVTPVWVYVTPLTTKLTEPSVNARPSTKLTMPALAARVCTWLAWLVSI